MKVDILPERSYKICVLSSGTRLYQYWGTRNILLHSIGSVDSRALATTF